MPECARGKRRGAGYVHSGNHGDEALLKRLTPTAWSKFRRGHTELRARTTRGGCVKDIVNKPAVSFVDEDEIGAADTPGAPCVAYVFGPDCQRFNLLCRLTACGRPLPDCVRLQAVESSCGAVALGAVCLLPRLSSGGARIPSP